MSKIKLMLEGEGEELFFKTLKSLNKIDSCLFPESAGTGSKIFLSSSDINTKVVNKRIEYCFTKGFNEVWFIADLENMDYKKISNSIDNFLNPRNEIVVKFFIEIKQLEGWLLSDINALKSILGNHKKISYNKITSPTDNISKPFELINKLYAQINKEYKKNSSEKKIAEQFKFQNGIINSVSLKFLYEYAKNEKGLKLI